MELQAQPEVSIQRDAGDVTIIGSQLVSPKLLDITAYLLSDPEYFGKITSVKQISFGENVPEGKYGAFNTANGEVAINLQKHFDATVEKLKTDDNIHIKYLSFKSILWFDLITTMLHEFFHAEVCDASPDTCEAALTDDTIREQIETDCISIASATIIDVFRDLDVEPPLMSTEPFFGTRYMQLFINEIKNGNEEWSIRQSIMHEKEYAFYDDNRDEGMKTMRSWMRTIEGADPDHKDKRWDEDPHSIQCVEKAAVLVDEPLEELTEPEIVALVDDAVATLDTTVVPAVEGPIEAGDVNAVAGDVPPWDPATLDPDTAMVMSMDMEEPAEEEAEYQNIYDVIAGARIPAQPGVDIVDPTSTIAHATSVVGPAGTKTWCPKCFDMFTTDAEGKICGNTGCGNTLVVALDPPAPAAVASVATELHTKPKCVCGSEVDETDRFCFSCGTSLVAAAPVVTGVPAAPPQAVLPVFAAPQGVVPSPVIPGAIPGAPAAPQFKQNLRMGLPNINMDQATMRGILEEIYRRMHEHAFTKCGFQLCGGQTGQDAGFNPAFAGNILQPINIYDIPGALDLVIGLDINDNTTGKTRMNQPIVDGVISGKLTKKDQLPSYAIYINNNGIEQKRVFMVQNPFKITGSSYSSTALKAQAGHQISWVWDGADDLGGSRRWIYKTENQFAQWLA